MYSSMGQLSAISPQSLLATPQTNTATGTKKKGTEQNVTAYMVHITKKKSLPTAFQTETLNPTLFFGA